jgi:hypothetical protein
MDNQSSRQLKAQGYCVLARRRTRLAAQQEARSLRKLGWETCLQPRRSEWVVWARYRVSAPKD